MASTTLPAMVSGNASASGAFQAQHEVWQENLEAEFALIRDIVQTYNYISMDTEFPGTVARPIGSFNGAGDFQFQTIRVNCDLLKSTPRAAAASARAQASRAPCAQAHEPRLRPRQGPRGCSSRSRPAT